MAIRTPPIRAALDGLPEPSSDDGRRLLVVTRNFLASEHWHAAMATGWPLVELFGVHAFAPLERIEGWGAVVALAWSRMSPLADEKITPVEIVIASRSRHAKLMHRPGS